MTRRLRDKVERLARVIRDREAQADASGDDVAQWARLFATAPNRDDPTPDDWAAAEAFAAAFVADCRARGVKPTWIELVKLAGEN